jgi:hypothetical protein
MRVAPARQQGRSGHRQNGPLEVCGRHPEEVGQRDERYQAQRLVGRRGDRAPVGAGESPVAATKSLST